MAIVNCSECNNKVSTEASSCPKCGAPLNFQKIQKKNEEKQKVGKGCGIAFVAVILMVFLYNTCDNGSTNSDSTEQGIYDAPVVISKEDSLKAVRINDSLENVAAVELAEFQKSKAGKIQNKHPDWSREDCEKLANKKIWIGMHYDMLVYLRGKPNTINTSNYGNGPEYQCCWDDYDPSCFYMKADDIIYSYN